MLLYKQVLGVTIIKRLPQLFNELKQPNCKTQFVPQADDAARQYENAGSHLAHFGKF